MDKENENPVMPIEIKPDLEKLRRYSQTKLLLAAQLGILREALTVLGCEQGERQCGELLVKLAEDRFTLAVVGQFKRGKSSLMNAIIGCELLPTGVLPLTSAITVLKYGPTERLVVCRENSIFPEELPVSALADYVTEKGDPSNQKKVKTACVELPVAFLRRGIEFVDTPGIGSSITANTVTTYGFLPECDAVLFVTSADMPMTDAEMVFLLEIRQYVEKIFFVVNKIDLVSDNERDEVVEFVSAAIQKQTGRDAVKIFPVSARQGIVARASGDAFLYDRSGIKDLEEALAFFLTEEKSLSLLVAVASKALQVLDAQMGQYDFGDIAVEARRAVMQNQKNATHRRDPQVAVAAATAARAQIEALSAGIIDGRIAEATDGEAVEINIEHNGDTQLLQVFAPASVAAQMAADLHAKGCPVCQYVAKQVADFFAKWQYRISIEARAQGEFAAEMGFCPLHTWQLLAVSSPHGASVGNAQLAETVARHLRKMQGASIGGAQVRKIVRDSTNCRVCKLVRRAEEEYIRQLKALISDASGRSIYKRSQGVCLRHLGMLMEADSTVETREFLLSHAAERFEEDAEDMRSFAMKQEAIRRGLQNSSEKDAYRRAIIRIAGDRRVCVPWAEDREI